MFYHSYEQQVRRAIVQVHNTCFYCKLNSCSNVDHLFPVSKGGISYLVNMVGSCKKCNGLKGNQLPTLEIYLAARQHCEERQYEVKKLIDYWGWPVRWVDYIEPKYHSEREVFEIKMEHN